MIGVFEKLLLLGLLILCQALATLQTPMKQNYTSEVLRRAKSAQIMAYLDGEYDPCRNFYKYACGKWPKLHPTSTSNVKTSYLGELQTLYIQKSIDMLKSERTMDSSADVKLKDFFESCRDEEALKKHGLQAIDWLVDFRGGWPKITSEAWYKSDYDWLRVVSEMRRKLGVNILLGMEVIPDLAENSMHRIIVGAPKFELASKHVYLKPEHRGIRERYKEQIKAKLDRFFHDMPAEWSTEVAQQVLDVEQQLAQGLPDDDNLTLKQVSELRTVSDLKAAYGNYVDVSRYLNHIFNQTIYVQVYESPIGYMSNLVEVIKLTPKLTIANYTMWRVLERLDFAGEINDMQNDKWCVHKTMEYFARPLEMMFHRNYNNMQTINDVQSVWADIKKTFREHLQSSIKLNWITDETRQKAALKLDAMEIEISSHDRHNDGDEMQNLNMKKDDYYYNLIQILQWQTVQDLAKLIEKPKGKEKAVKLPQYEPTRNKVLIPISFLQSRYFWDPAYPVALKFATIGVLLAQEMVHGFDAVGHQFDSHGAKRTWWDSVSEYALSNRSKCFDKQYSNYKFHEQTPTEQHIQAIGISDNGGLSIAYKTYQTWLKYVADNELTSLESLPLLDYSPNKLFFIGYAQLWCADYHDSVVQFTEVPERLRVIGALANTVDFPREFQCDIGGKMNPETKCVIY